MYVDAMCCSVQRYVCIDTHMHGSTNVMDVHGCVHCLLISRLCSWLHTDGHGAPTVISSRRLDDNETDSFKRKHTLIDCCIYVIDDVLDLLFGVALLIWASVECIARLYGLFDSEPIFQHEQT